MEVCVDSVASAIAAEEGGAQRLELCANLMEGGTTPTVGMLKVILRNVSIPVFVMLRPRGGDFVYTKDEFKVILQDLDVLGQAGAGGFVFGSLYDDGTVDNFLCKDVIAEARDFKRPVTFHRAIDMTEKPLRALEKVISLGFTRVLTSGGESSALEGAPIIAEMVKLAGDRIIVMPGGGVTGNNLERILKQTGAKEFHCSARTTKPSKMHYKREGVTMGASLSPPEFSVKVTCPERVKRLVVTARNIWESQ